LQIKCRNGRESAEPHTALLKIEKRDWHVI
jgi:hypothetical protein